MSDESPTQHATATATPQENESNPTLHPLVTFVTRMICAANDMDPSPDEAALMHKIVRLLEVNKTRTHGPGSLTSRCKAVLSPIRRVPTEIWAMIFAESLRNDEDFQKVERNKAPLNISWVCQRWRAIAISTPSLWRSIAITRTLALDDCYPRRELVSLWLARSAPHSISFLFCIEDDMNICSNRDESPHEPKRNSPNLRALVGELLRCRPRWKSVCLDLPFLDGYDIPVFEAGAPWLESVQVTRRTAHSLTRLDQFIHRIWENAPRLRSFYLCDETECGRGDKSLLPLPYGLTELKLEYDLSLRECWGIFRASPGLAVCFLGRVSGVDDSSMNVTPVFLSKLRSLTLESTICDFGEAQEDSHLTNVLTLITAPNLQKFAMRWDNGYLHEPLVSFITRSACALTDLVIDCVPIAEGELEEVLELTSEFIKVLRFHEEPESAPFGKDLLRSLTWKGPDKKFLCPNLEIISFDASTVIGKRYSSFIAMVESRWHVDDGRIQLKEVELITSEQDPHSFNQLEKFAIEGLAVRLKYRHRIVPISDWEDEDTEEDREEGDTEERDTEDEGTEDEDTEDEDTE